MLQVSYSFSAVLTSNSRTSTFSIAAILNKDSTLGCIELEHQRDTVDLLYPNCSASQALFLSCSASTIRMRWVQLRFVPLVSIARWSFLIRAR